MNDTATPPRVPLVQLRRAGADRITEELRRALPEAEQRETSGGFNSAI